MRITNFRQVLPSLAAPPSPAGRCRHSILTGAKAEAEDNSAYVNLFAVALYPYNLDQVGAFPAG